jgi:hypothetical protein
MEVGQQVYEIIQIQNMFPIVFHTLKEIHVRPTKSIMQPNNIPSTSTKNPSLPYITRNTNNNIPFLNESLTFSNLKFNVINQTNSITSTPNAVQNEKHQKKYVHRKDEQNKHRQLSRSKEKYISMQFQVDPIQHQSFSHIATTFCTTALVGQ